jgi:hypothetical protein
MVEVATRTLRNYLSTLTAGGTAGVVDQNLDIRNDLVTTAQGLPAGGNTGEALTKVSGTNFDVAWTAMGAGDMLQAMYDPQAIQSDAFARENHTGTQSVTTITGLATVATSGSYADLSNKPTYFSPRSISAATAPTLTPNADLYDVVSLTAQATALAVAAPSGTPLDGQQLVLRLHDNGTSRAITWAADFAAFDATHLPAATVIGKTMYYVFRYNSATVKWDLVGGTPIPGLFGY